MPGLDGVIGTRRWMDILSFIERVRGRAHPAPLFHLPDEATTVGDDERGVLRAAVQGPSAYLKIADGCRRPCAFCTIPIIKGTLKSRPPEQILAEARQLAERGVRELVLIAQDLTDYGSDLGLRDGLAHLVTAITQAAPALDWVRLIRLSWRGERPIDRGHRHQRQGGEMPGHALATRPSRHAAPDAPAEQHGLGLSHA